MNYFKQKMDDDDKTFIIVFCFLLLGIFVIVPMVLLFHSRNLRLSYLYEDLSFLNNILFGYCLVALGGAAFFLYHLYNSRREKTISRLEEEIRKKIKSNPNAVAQSAEPPKIDSESIKDIVRQQFTELFNQKEEEINKELRKILELEDKKSRYRLVEKTVESSKDNLNDSLILLIRDILNLRNEAIEDTSKIVIQENIQQPDPKVSISKTD